VQLAVCLAAASFTFLMSVTAAAQSGPTDAAPPAEPDPEISLAKSRCIRDKSCAALAPLCMTLSSACE
jgi:hypothetical protein